MGFKLDSGLNAGESDVRFPATVSELATAGLCQHCLENGFTRPLQLEDLTVEEIDAALSTLDEE